MQMIPQQFPSLNQPLPVRLDKKNSLLWQNQLQNVIIANGLEGFIEGTIPCPTQFLDQQMLGDKSSVYYLAKTE